MTEVSCILITSYQEDLNLDKWAEVLFVRFLYSKVTAPFLTSLLGGSKSLSTEYTQAWGGGKGKVSLIPGVEKESV